jgi:hypothetical protein
MPFQTDLNQTLDRVASQISDATCELRAAAAQRLPAPHHRLITSAIGHLERGQQAIFAVRNDPWAPRPAKPVQLELL